MCLLKYKNNIQIKLIKIYAYKTGEVHGYIQKVKTSIHIHNNKMNTV